ncbi:3-hydroxyisobutyrate dehydrogenase [Geodermatophilus pulveris]|uniref:3-hydroxyisobutyrate dehydrogenase n=1 Tax=Geodermatophilus pulveris TaxID=1564159 RepID=A0A239CEN9_9ACTN|nr:NAD(P)-dependent oxidoreductase [Geodermatophilus pulveris]SNS17934.1 3-hydroxyisobutyrate dehydrogenase [Geodermatophilus pulveris]
MDRPPAIALLGLGEAGGELARDLVAAGADVRGYDPRVAAPPGVRPRDGEAAAVADADLVLSVNSAADAPVALRNALPALRAGTVWADLNTAAPGVKRGLAAALAGRDVPVADVALLSTVPGKGLRTPMLVSGDGAAAYARVLAGLGVTVDVLDGPPGAAISRKLLRSVFWKGVAAAVVEAMEGAEAAGVADWLRADIGAELDRFGAADVDALVAGSHRHARRRSAEMAAAAEQLRDLGVPPRVAGAARDQLAALADPGCAG